MKITILGTGYVGLVTGTCLADWGNQVTCVDVDPVRIRMLQSGRSPIHESGLEELIQANLRDGRLVFSLSDPLAIQSADVIFICVGTPCVSAGDADLTQVVSVADRIGEAIETQPGPGVSPKVVVVKSTVPVGTNDKVREVITKHTARPFHMASNPEFLREGVAVRDFNAPDRVVLGTDSVFAEQVLRRLYEPFSREGRPVHGMDIRSAEMVKYAANTFLATKISFMNEVAGLCEALQVDVDAVWRGLTSDTRIGTQFLHPGLGYGGSCFPKDVQAMVAMGRQAGRPALILEQVHAVNQRQRSHFLAKIDSHFQAVGLRGRRFAVWGIAFKPGTDDIREAPSLDIMRGLIERGVAVTAYDPQAMEVSRRHGMGDAVRYAPNMYDALDGADALVVCTDWPQFKEPDLARMRASLRCPLVFDGRNIWQPAHMREAGFSYFSIGRLPVVADGSTL